MASRKFRQSSRQPEHPKTDQPSGVEPSETYIAVPQTAYDRRKERERKRQADQSRDARDIGPVPPVADPELRQHVSDSLLAFCMTCFPRAFYLELSDDQREAISIIQDCVEKGRLFALAMPRSSGKSTILTIALLWAILTGRRKYVCLIGCDKNAATKLLANIKLFLESNDKLLELFPEVCFPIRKLDRKPNKCKGQLSCGEPTRMTWNGYALVLPTIKTSGGDGEATYTRQSGAVIECCWIMGSIRGKNLATVSGEQLRPDLFLLDDPQNEKTARSTLQTERRLDILQNAILELAGPDVSIAGFAAVTVICKDDLADQLLDENKFPEWQGKRYQTIYDWPTNMSLWEQYGVKLAESMRITKTIEMATAWYVANRDAMDAGHRIAWPARFKADKGEISGLQSAMNKFLTNPVSFFSEYQNDPRGTASDVQLLTVDQLEHKTSNYMRAELPAAANLITSFIDVQGELLYWLTVAWERDTFSGWVLEYGTWPEQVSNHFSLRSAQQTLSKKYPGMGQEARWTAGLNGLITWLAAKSYSGQNRSLSIELLGIDQAYGNSTKTVRSIVQSHPNRTLLLACMGRYVAPDARSMNDWPIKAGELRGDNWLCKTASDGGRLALADSNAWKSFANARLNVATGDSGSLSLYRPKLETEHRLFAEHCRAEVCTIKSSKEIWTSPPNRPDNHWWDGLYWTAVLAAIRGARLSHLLPTARKSKRKPKRASKLVT
jgi:hypothetical protein